ncbi:efflux RND transporter periplasmic adaptor subunit [Patescibacteria group bacterium]
MAKKSTKKESLTKKAVKPVNGAVDKGKSIFTKIKSFLTWKRVVILLIIIAVIVGWKYYSNQKAQRGAKTETVKVGVIREELILTGDVVADLHAQMKFPTSGKLSWMGVSEGDWVWKGQALASLDRTTLDAAYQQARSNLRKYDATVDRVHDDLKDKDSTETFTEIETRVTAEATKDYYWDAFRTAEYNLRNANLYAPFAGLVTYISSSFGGVNVLFSDIQVELVDPKTIYFDVSADQSEVTSLKVGQKAIVVLDSFPDKEFEGEISYISYTPKAGEVGAVYEIKVIFPQEDPDFNKVRVGMTGDARFTLSEKMDALYIPVEFLNTDKQGKYVNLSRLNNKVYVEIGVEGEDTVEIIGDVKEGDVVFD